MKIYLFPFLIDFVLFLVMLSVSDAAGREMKLSNLEAACLVIGYSLAYLVACPLAGRVLTRENSRQWLVGSVWALLLCSVPAFFARSFWPTLGLMVAIGVVVGFAFNSVQAFLRGESKQGGLSRTIAKYTLSWSMGIACGFLFGGVLLDVGGPWALAACSALACGGILWMVKTHPTREQEFVSAQGSVEDPTGRGVLIDTRYVAIGWLLCISANFCQRPLTTFIPKLAAEQQNAAWVAGSLLFALYVCQGAGGYIALRRRQLLYQRGPLIALQVGIALLTALLWKSPNFAVSIAAMALIGLAYGHLYFACVYYVSNHIHSARSVGINEAMVGLGTILGVFFSELIMRRIDNTEAFYPVTIGAGLALAAAQWLWLHGPARNTEDALAREEAAVQQEPAAV